MTHEMVPIYQTVVATLTDRLSFLHIILRPTVPWLLVSKKILITKLEQSFTVESNISWKNDSKKIITCRFH